MRASPTAIKHPDNYCASETQRDMVPTHHRRGSLANKGQARLGYIYASPLVQLRVGRKERMELLDTAQVLL